MQILLVTGSPRKGGNTEIMAETFREEAEKAGHQVTLRKLSEMTIRPCLDCKYCFSHDGVCVQKDDMNLLLQDTDRADLLVLASPIYWFDLSAQSKCFIDRLYAHAQKGFHIRSFALLLDSGSEGVYEAAKKQAEMICGFLHWELKGIVTIPHMAKKGSMHAAPELEQVQKLAQSLT